MLHRMINVVNHRGPDAVGFHLEGPVALGHARLSIIDLAGGAQPMTNEDRSLWITFNGEIFNYVELRNELINKGHRFRTQSDTEVILHLYEEKGDACVQDLNGQWAFAIWDPRRERLFLSRDRLGIRPLFYAKTKSGFAFASEMKSLLAIPSLSRMIDPHALDQIFTCWVTIPPTTVFSGISELPPGHCLTLQEGKMEVTPYWALEYDTDATVKSEDEAREKLLALLLDATRLRLRSDVPVGAYLSGGLDSTVVAALIKKLGVTHVKTFSVAFDDKEYDESAFQEEARQFLGTDHQAVLCRPTDIGEVFPDVIWHTETPVIRTAPAPLFLLSKLVREQGYKVVLTGGRV